MSRLNYLQLITGHWNKTVLKYMQATGNLGDRGHSIKDKCYSALKGLFDVKIYMHKQVSTVFCSVNRRLSIWPSSFKNSRSMLGTGRPTKASWCIRVVPIQHYSTVAISSSFHPFSWFSGSCSIMGKPSALVQLPEWPPVIRHLWNSEQAEQNKACEVPGECA